MKRAKTNAMQQVEDMKKLQRKPPMPRPVIINHKKMYNRNAMKRVAYDY